MSICKKYSLIPTVITAVTTGYKCFRCLATNCSLFGHRKDVWPADLIFNGPSRNFFQMKLLISDRPNKALSAFNGNTLVYLFKRYIRSCNGEFHIILQGNPTDLCVCVTPHFNTCTIISLTDKYTF